MRAVDAAGSSRSVCSTTLMRLDELAPVDRAEEAQAADAVADRDLVGGLLLGLATAPAARSSGRSPTRRCSIQVSGSASAAPWPCRRRASSATNELGHRRVRARHVGDDEDQALRIALGDLDHPVGPGVGEVALGACRRRCARATRRRFSISARRSMIGIAHSSPRLSGVDALVGGDEAAQAFARRRRPSPCAIASSAMS